MANHKGSEGVVKVGAVTVAEVRGFEFTQSAETIEDTTLADTEKTFQVGNTEWSGSLSCWWDETDTTGQGALTAGASVTLNLYPEGATTGDKYYTGTALITSLAIANAINGIVSAEFQFKGTGALTLSTAA